MKIKVWVGTHQIGKWEIDFVHIVSVATSVGAALAQAQAAPSEYGDELTHVSVEGPLDLEVPDEQP